MPADRESVIISPGLHNAGAMKVKVRLLPGKKRVRTLELGARSTVEDALRSLGLYPDAWIAVRGQTPVPLDERLRDGDELKLISAVSGG